mmetsp:Transcript_8971/g.21329  ORF Transcript_8971/g.21329 Transcript_8971/m.21329 type:complete len:203 (-) Transcript_8971:839-1447(-)
MQMERKLGDTETTSPNPLGPKCLLRGNRTHRCPPRPGPESWMTNHRCCSFCTRAIPLPWIRKLLPLHPNSGRHCAQPRRRLQTTHGRHDSRRNVFLSARLLLESSCPASNLRGISRPLFRTCLTRCSGQIRPRMSQNINHGGQHHLSWAVGPDVMWNPKIRTATAGARPNTLAFACWRKPGNPKLRTGSQNPRRRLSHRRKQ